MKKETLKKFLGKKVIIYLWDHRVDVGTLRKHKNLYSCCRGKGFKNIYYNYEIVGIAEVKNEQRNTNR